MPKVNGKEYPYTEAGMAAAKKAAQSKKKKAAPPAKGVASRKAIAQSNEKMKDMKKPKVSGSATTMGMPSKAMNKAIPGNKGGGINLGSAAKKFVMSMPPVAAANVAAKAGRAIGNAINPPMEKQLRRLPGTIGDRMPRPGATPLPRKVAPGPLDQMRKMNEMPKRQPKKLLPKKSGR